MVDKREIYSIRDAQDIIEKVLKDELGLGYEVIEAINKRIGIEFDYINWVRFQRACCPGCVSSPDECSVAYGRDEFYGVWDKIHKGEITRCPARVNGTFTFEEGAKKNIDLQGDAYTVVAVSKTNRQGGLK